MKLIICGRKMEMVRKKQKNCMKKRRDGNRRPPKPMAQTMPRNLQFENYKYILNTL